MKHLYLFVFAVVTALCSACNKDVVCHCEPVYAVHSADGVVTDTMYDYLGTYPDQYTTAKECTKKQVHHSTFGVPDSSGHIYAVTYTRYMECEKLPL